MSHQVSSSNQAKKSICSERTLRKIQQLIDIAQVVIVRTIYCSIKSFGMIVQFGFGRTANHCFAVNGKG